MRGPYQDGHIGVTQGGDYSRLWLDFYQLDGSDREATRRFISEKRLVRSHLDVDERWIRTMQWDPDFRSEHRQFRWVVDALMRDGTGTQEVEPLTILNEGLAGAHPVLVRWEDVGYELQPTPQGYTSIGDIYLSFAQALARQTAGNCAYCGNPFVLNERQRAAMIYRGQKVYDSEECRQKAKDAKPERKARKAEGMRRLRARRRQAKKERGG